MPGWSDGWMVLVRGGWSRGAEEGSAPNRKRCFALFFLSFLPAWAAIASTARLLHFQQPARQQLRPKPNPEFQQIQWCLCLTLGAIFPSLLTSVRFPDRQRQGNRQRPARTTDYAAIAVATARLHVHVTGSYDTAATLFTNTITLSGLHTPDLVADQTTAAHRESSCSSNL